mmetsp:Transcript_24985/g.60358  ORF Transcript_24985/g.60358 Transcript_24985/m.60358 type:complete len:326 (-) Transcript_24985:333-1310(-)
MIEQISIAAQGGGIMLRDSFHPPAPPSLLLTVQGGTTADVSIRLRQLSEASPSPSPVPVRRETEEEPLVRSAVELQELLSEKATHCWSAIAPSSFHVRGANYLRDGVKVAAPLLSQCLAVELFRAKQAVPNVAGRAGSPLASLAQRCDVPLKTIFVVVIIIPTGRWAVHIAMYFGVYASIDTVAPAAATLLDRFLSADDAFRNQRFKVFTKLAKGPLPARLTTPQRPALSGRSVPHHYHVAPGYVEVDMDVSRDPTAARALKILKPVSKILVVDVGFILEGREDDELPEMVFGAARLLHLNISDAKVPLLEGEEEVRTSSRRSFG